MPRPDVATPGALAAAPDACHYSRVRTEMRRPGIVAGILISWAAVAAAQPGLPESLRTMVETEREFARTALVKGVRDAFLEFFADDSIAFTPGVVSAKE